MKIRSLGLVFLLVSTSMFAQSARVFVSGNGNDANLCTVSSPCRSFTRAVAAVASGGEIIPLDSAGYGTVVIDRSLSISAPDGIYAGVTASGSGATGINITALSSSVSLRGISVNGVGGQDGILTTVDGVTLQIERVTVSHFSDAGIVFVSRGGKLFVTDCTLRDPGNGGIYVSGVEAGQTALATIDHVRTSGAGNSAIYSDAYSDTTVRDCVSAQNFRGFGAFSGTARLTVENCAATDNVVGVFATTTGCVVYVSNSVISHNTLYGIEAQVGTQILSRGNNTVIANAGAEIFSGTFAAQ